MPVASQSKQLTNQRYGSKLAVFDFLKKVRTTKYCDLLLVHINVTQCQQ